MLKVENTETYGWKAAIRGMRNPLNSWDKSDSMSCGQKLGCTGCHLCEDKYADMTGSNPYVLGENDLTLMKKLAAAGSDHGKFMRMITVTCDIVAPLYWWKEYDTYKVGTVANSCSTMHKIADKKFTLEDFSCEHLITDEDITTFESCWLTPKDILLIIIDTLNGAREKFLETKDKKYWWQMIQLLPCSYNQRRTVQINYAVLKNIYNARRAHKLTEWVTFCEWIEHLPYSELITET